MSDIQIYEVGPRDGLQNIEEVTPTTDKINLIKNLYEAGLHDIEVTSFVHPKLVPNMADAEDVFKATKDIADFSVLVPNQKGFDRAHEVGAKKMNVFFSASDSFNRANLGKNMTDVLSDIDVMLENTNKKDVRAYISCAFGCPIEGRPSEYKLFEAIKAADSIADTIVLCDTIGSAHPSLIKRTSQVAQTFDSEIALHLHHKRNKKDNMFPNIRAGLESGITQFDASIGGLGGCPFIPGSGSNLSTNDLVRFLHKRNYDTGLDIWLLDDIAQSYTDDIIPHTPISLRVKNKLGKIFDMTPMSSKW
tara:strand:- start:8441 stop:9355 length:915 start_codon:yes stop_codon:yes gene_type:complete